MITCTISPCREIRIHAPSSPVEGEHNANTMAISVPPQLAGIDLAGCTMYACTCNDQGQADKVPLEMSPTEDGYTATWTITRNTTALHGDIILYFEWDKGTDLVAKTYPTNLKIVDVPDVDGEIEVQYPTILQDHEARIEYLEKHGGIGGVASPDIDTIRVIDRDDFEKLPAKDPDTLYFLRG